MFASTRENHGKYTLMSYIKRGWELCSPKSFISFRKGYDFIESAPGVFRMLLDYYVCLVRYGATASDYFEYEFWKKRHCERKTYVTMLYSRKIQSIFNKGDIELFLDKEKFNKAYSKYRTIRNFSFTAGGGINEFHRFCKECNYRILMKPCLGASGIGIYKPDISSEEKIEALYKEMKGTDKYFAEQMFIQTGSLHEVNPDAVNTIRIFTLFDGEKVNIMYTGVRFGGGNSIVDNIHSGGMVCEIDPDTGKVVGPGYNLKNYRFVRHPRTKVFLPGLQVPRWQEVKRVVLEAAMLNPSIGHCAWDVAVSEEMVSLIEANDQGNFDLIQSASQRGCKPDYDRIIKKIKCNEQTESVID